MRVVANLSFIVPGSVGGSEEYSVRLLGSVAGRNPDDLSVEIAGPRSLFVAHPELHSASSHGFAGPVRRRAYRLAVESTWLARVSRGAALTHHFGGRIPARRTGPSVVTIHDIQPLDLPAHFSPVKQQYLQWALPRTVQHAAMICTPSQWVADRVVDRLGADPERVRVVSSTWDPRHSSGPADDVATGFVGRPMVLYPAVTHPHKNHVVLLEAMKRVVQRHPDAVLVLTGGTGRAHEEVMAHIDRNDVSDGSVCHLGRVAAGTLSELVARADVVAFPSVYEGFGLPVLEAMHRGTPVVAADATALPEVLGGAGQLVASDDVEEWAEALGSLLDDDPRRAEMSVAGIARSDAYSPTVAADALVAAWRDAAA